MTATRTSRRDPTRAGDDLDQLGHPGRIARVQDLGPVQGDAGHGPVELESDGVHHLPKSSRGSQMATGGTSQTSTSITSPRIT